MLCRGLHHAINGWVLDPDRKKMSKSKGNVITPHALIEEHGAEAVRYWSCNGRPGTDTAVDHGVMRIGRRLATKILSASRFALGFAEDVDPSAISASLDRSMLATLVKVVEGATEAFDAFDYARALEIIERSFWTWTDDYLELVKGRAYEGGNQGASAHAALQMALGVYLRLFAPFLPFVTEEVWSWWRGIGSPGKLAQRRGARPCSGDPAVLTETGAVLSAVRKAKSDAKVSMRAEVESVSVSAGRTSIELVRQAEDDLKAAARAETVLYSEGEFAVESVLSAN